MGSLNINDLFEYFGYSNLVGEVYVGKKQTCIYLSEHDAFNIYNHIKWLSSRTSLYRIVTNIEKYLSCSDIISIYMAILVRYLKKYFDICLDKESEKSLRAKISLYDIKKAIKFIENFDISSIKKSWLILCKYIDYDGKCPHIYLKFFRDIKISDVILESKKTGKFLSWYIRKYFSEFGCQLPKHIFENILEVVNINNSEKHDIKPWKKCKMDIKVLDNVRIRYCLPEIPDYLRYTTTFINKLQVYLLNFLAIRRIEWEYLKIFKLPHHEIICSSLTKKIALNILSLEFSLCDLAVLENTHNNNILTLLLNDIINIVSSAIIKSSGGNFCEMDINRWAKKDKDISTIIILSTVQKGGYINTEHFNEMYKCRQSSLNTW